jgi:galactan endo-1,6-beta-galactosidase
MMLPANLDLTAKQFRILLLCAAAVFLVYPAKGASLASPLTVRINPAVEYGTWEGWGTSLCWMANVFGDRADLADLLFTTKSVRMLDENLPGLGMNIVRYNAGASSASRIDGRKMVVSKIIEPYRQMESFWLDGGNPDPKSASWNWNADGRQRSMLIKARDRGATRFELFSNSAPWWMTANDNPSGGPKPSDDNLPVKNHPAFATYLATIASHAKAEWGIHFTTVSPFNEPMSSWWFADCKQEGCHFSQSSQAGFLPILRAELDRQGLRDLPIAASDETHYDHAVGTWKSFSPEVKALVSQVNVHGYQMGGGDRAGLYRSVVVEDGKRLWNSEHGDADGSGLEMARNFHRDMSRLHPTAWCYWQPTDGGGWGMLDCSMRKAEIRSINPKLFVFAQYSRHIRPGMVILETDDERTVAAYSAASSKLVLVTLNDGPARRVTYDLSKFSVPNGQVPTVVTEPKGSARYKLLPQLQLTDKHFTVDLAADSIQTFQIFPASVTGGRK